MTFFNALEVLWWLGRGGWDEESGKVGGSSEEGAFWRCFSVSLAELDFGRTGFWPG